MRIDRIGFKVVLKYSGDFSHILQAYKMVLFRTDFETVQKIYDSMSMAEREYLTYDHSSISERKKLLKFVENKYHKFMKKQKMNCLNPISSQMENINSNLKSKSSNKLLTWCNN